VIVRASAWEPAVTDHQYDTKGDHVSRTASRLAAIMLAAGALATAAALPASAADHGRGHHNQQQPYQQHYRQPYQQPYQQQQHQEHYQQHYQQQRAQVVLGAVHHTTSDRSRSDRSLNNEWITVTNEGRRAVSLDGWTLTDADHHTYRFGRVTLQAHESVRVHTGSGRNTSRDLYQGRDASVWSRSDDTATLRDDRGRVVDTESWGWHGRR
jgi:hypothetical protein